MLKTDDGHSSSKICKCEETSAMLQNYMAPCDFITCSHIQSRVITDCA